MFSMTSSTQGDYFQPMLFFVTLMMIAFSLLFAAFLANAPADRGQFSSLDCHSYGNSGGRFFWIAIVVSLSLFTTNLPSMSSFSISATLSIIAIFTQAIISIWAVGIFEKFRSVFESIAPATFFGKLYVHRKTSFLDAMPPDVQSSRRFNYIYFSHIGKE